MQIFRKIIKRDSGILLFDFFLSIIKNTSYYIYGKGSTRHVIYEVKYLSISVIFCNVVCVILKMEQLKIILDDALQKKSSGTYMTLRVSTESCNRF